MRKPKVAFIHPAIGDSFGGSQIFVLELAERLRRKCEVTILSAKSVNDLCKPVFSISRGNDTYKNHIFYRQIREFLRKFASTPDVVIEHFSSFVPVLYELINNDYDVIFPNNDWGGLLVASLARKIKGIPILFTEHNGLMEKGKIAERNLRFNPDKYITLSQDMKIWVKKYYPDVDVEYIPNGVDFIKFNPSVKPKVIDLPGPIILTVSRNQPNKRLELVIDAVEKLDKGSLLLVCPDKDVEYLNKRGQEILGEGRFKVTSSSNIDIASFYRACDVFTLPSIYEPFGLVYLEAMACNKPVVAPNDLSRTEIVGKAGILCDVSDIDEYSRSLELALNTDYGEVPFKQAQKYTWENTADKYYEVIQSIMQKKFLQEIKADSP